MIVAMCLCIRGVCMQCVLLEVCGFYFVHMNDSSFAVLLCNCAVRGQVRRMDDYRCFLNGCLCRMYTRWIIVCVRFHSHHHALQICSVDIHLLPSTAPHAKTIAYPMEHGTLLNWFWHGPDTHGHVLSCMGMSLLLYDPWVLDAWWPLSCSCELVQTNLQQDCFA